MEPLRLGDYSLHVASDSLISTFTCCCLRVDGIPPSWVEFENSAQLASGAKHVAPSDVSSDKEANFSIQGPVEEHAQRTRN